MCTNADCKKTTSLRERDLKMLRRSRRRHLALSDREFAFRHIRQLAKLIERDAKDIAEFVYQARLRPDLLTDNEAETLEEWLEDAAAKLKTAINEQRFRQRGGSVRRRRRFRR